MPAKVIYNALFVNLEKQLISKVIWQRERSYIEPPHHHYSSVCVYTV